MVRKEDWRRHLRTYIDGIRYEPYALGQQDCWMLVAGAIEAMTGVDLAASQRGKYKSAKGALGIVKRAKARNMADFAALHLEEQHPIQAQIGDVMAMPTDDAFGFSLGILNGERVLVVTPTGIDTRDRSEATRSFRV